MSAAKTLKYSQDGTGRDSYIYTNNGGYYPPIPSVVKVDTGKYSKSNQRSSSTSNWVRPKKYTTNGTGRDLYVNANSSDRVNFLKALRSTDGFYGCSQTSRPKATIQEQEKQFLNTWRLSQPKPRNAGQDYTSQLSENYTMRQTTKSNFWKGTNPQRTNRSSFKQQ